MSNSKTHKKLFVQLQYPDVPFLDYTAGKSQLGRNTKMDDVHLFVSQGQILFTMLNNILTMKVLVWPI
jgi:hypothetical protein